VLVAASRSTTVGDRAPGHQQRAQLAPDPLQTLFVAGLRPVRAKLSAIARKRAHERHDKHEHEHLLMAKSGHENLRSLQKYARPSADAVAAMTAAHDPARRRR
jgi:hypothetical protein